MIRILVLIGFLLLVGNLLVVNYFVFQHNSKFEDTNTRILTLADSVKAARNSITQDVSSASSNVVSDIEGDNCGTKCQAMINAAVDAKVKTIKSTTSTKTVVKAAPTGSTQEFIIPMGGGVVSQNGQWVDIYSAQTQINTANYPPIVAAYFEVVMGIPNAQGTMQAQLYDTSTPYLFSGQVLSTQSGPGQFLSVQFPIQPGNKSYHVQLQNSIGTGILDSSRIRLVTQ